jgi:hypothetical protein
MQDRFLEVISTKPLNCKLTLGSFFLKQHDDRLADMFEKEFSGLNLLDQTKNDKSAETYPARAILK